jgi:spore maturation protein CgeB
MKILVTFPGHLKTVPMGGYACAALARLGNDVSCFNFSLSLKDKLFSILRPQRNKHHFLNNRFMGVVKKQNPCVVIHVFGFDLDQRSSEFLKNSAIKSVCWWINDPFQFKRSLARAVLFDAVFTNAKGCVDRYREEGISHAFWLPTAADPGAHFPVDAEDRYQCDICFVGDWSSDREEWCAYLAERFDVLVVGPWGKKLSLMNPKFRLLDQFFDVKLMRAVFSSAKIVFNLHTWRESSSTGTNPRLFEAAACGAIQLVDNKEEIPDLFKIGEDLLIFEDKDDLRAQAEKILQNPEMAVAMRASARKAALARHTYQHRMSNLLSMIEKLGVYKK